MTFEIFLWAWLLAGLIGTGFGVRNYLRSSLRIEGEIVIGDIFAICLMSVLTVVFAPIAVPLMAYTALTESRWFDKPIYRRNR